MLHPWRGRGGSQSPNCRITTFCLVNGRATMSLQGHKLEHTFEQDQANVVVHATSTDGTLDGIG
jgi:hypothetical protein